MEKKYLIASLKKIAKTAAYDPESAHGTADDLLLAFIADDKVKEAYDDIEKWYA